MLSSISEVRGYHVEVDPMNQPAGLMNPNPLLNPGLHPIPPLRNNTLCEEQYVAPYDGVA